jgi:hypothetical protein
MLQVTAVDSVSDVLNVQVSELADDGSVLHQENFSFNDTVTPSEALGLIRQRFDLHKDRRSNLDKLRKGLTVGREIPSS